MTESTQPPTSERWLPVVGYEGLYDVSDRGRIRRVGRAAGRRVLPERILRPFVSGHPPERLPYLAVKLVRDGVRKTNYVHRMVLTAFVREPDPSEEGIHLDTDYQNNQVENLIWGTRSISTLNSVRHGRHHVARNGGECLPLCPFGRAGTGERLCKSCQREHDIAFLGQASVR